jgi:Glycosyltransferase family 87
MIFATVAMIVHLLVTSHGTVDHFGRPLGTDFSNVWTAGKMALDNNAADAWDWSRQRAMQQAAHHDVNIPFYGWHYPPPFLLIATLLALLPYTAALVAWQASTLTLAIKTMRAILPGTDATLAAFGFPVVLICLGHGHNGFLTGALIGGGMLLLDRRPFIAGLLLGCMIYKPQFGLIIPVMLLFGGHFRAIGGACVSAALLCILTYALWGWPVWQAFVDSLPLSQAIVIEQGATGWEKIQSAFSATRAWGGSVRLGWAVQSCFTGGAIVTAAWISRRVTPDVRNAAVIMATLLSTPYILDYDLIPMGFAIAFLVKDGLARGFLSHEKTIYAFAWFAPLVGRAAMSNLGIPLGLMSMVALIALSCRRALVLDKRDLRPL